MPEYALYNCPDNVGLDTAALVEPLAVGWHAVNSSPFKSSDTALVLGGGPIGGLQSVLSSFGRFTDSSLSTGLSVVQALRARGCPQIIVSEVSSMRKRYAQEFGAHIVLDPTKDDIVARCLELTKNKGSLYPQVVSLDEEQKLTFRCRSGCDFRRCGSPNRP